MADESEKKKARLAAVQKGMSAHALDEFLASFAQQSSLFAHMPNALALSETLKGIEASSRQWEELSQSLDWSKSVGLHAEALRAMDLASAVQLQTEALKALDWDVTRLPRELRSPLSTAPSEAGASTLEHEIRKLREAIAKQSEALLAEKADAVEKQKRIADLDTTLAQLRQRERLAFLLNQVHPAAQGLLDADEGFRNRFLESKDCTGFVLSVDIRRSTELMLKARKPERFAAFIAMLSRQLTKVVLESFGVFDKFTGDGILAFFPDFYSGPDAGFHAVAVASRCHEIFQAHYRDHRSAFMSVTQETGLGIGIDFGTLHLVQVAGALTVVGPPVVYACRLGGAPPGATLLNQPAFEVLSERHGLHFAFEETSHELKHEGRTLAYRVHPTGKFYEPRVPDWFKPSTVGTGSAAAQTS